LTDFNKSPNYKISKKSGQWKKSCSMQESRHTGRLDEANACFSQLYEEA